MKERAQQLHDLGHHYVHCLGTGNFDGIPYHEKVELRAPINPGGSEAPMTGRSTLREKWWAPLPDLVSGVEVLDTYVNKDMSAVTVEFLCRIDALSSTLRIVDRFRVNERGQITAQENFFDPRDITNPGWRDQ
jgi:hypothetical protein